MAEATYAEVAWDGRGRWCGDGPRPHTARPPTEVPHTCGLGQRPRRANCGVFVCHQCKRCVPWCFGGSGQLPIEDVLCDECWAAMEPAGVDIELVLPNGRRLSLSGYERLLKEAVPARKARAEGEGG